MAFYSAAKACHDKLYPNEDKVHEWLDNTRNFKIPSELVPVCPVCGEEMDLNLRKDSFFVEDDDWRVRNKRYYDFLDNIGGKFVFLEIGVGFNTPGIIRYPFEQMTYSNPDATLIRLNLDYPQAIPENKDKTISFDENVEEILGLLDFKNLNSLFLFLRRCRLILHRLDLRDFPILKDIK